VSFQGRAIDQRAIKKYLFPPGFSVSGSVIYNAHQAVAADTIILGEGVFDAMAIKIAIDRHRIENTVATASFGKHLACKSNGDDDQLSALLKLKKWFGLETIVLCWDGEKSAIYAALETMKKLEHVGFKTQFMRLPDNEDPGSIPASTLIDCFHRAEIYSPSLLTKAKLGAI
jgi:DNA primase